MGYRVEGEGAGDFEFGLGPAGDFDDHVVDAVGFGVEEGDVVEGGDGDPFSVTWGFAEEVDFVGEGVGTVGFGEGVFVFCVGVVVVVGVVVIGFVMVVTVMFTTVVLGKGGLVKGSHVGLMSHPSCCELLAG